MENQIDWEDECVKIAAELVDDICCKFVNNEEIKLYMSRPIAAGDVYGLLAHTPLHDEWNTVIVEYSAIPRGEITLDRELLYKKALENALHTANHPDVMLITDYNEHRRRIAEWAEWAIGAELAGIFSRTAIAAPDKYPIWKTHAHAAPRIDSSSAVKFTFTKKMEK